VQVRDALQRLADRGLRLTQQRRCIVAQIGAQEAHFDAEDLVSSLAAGDDRVSRATVYRLLPVLVEVGVLREVMRFGSRREFEPVEASEHHEHLVCERCGAVIEFRDQALEDAIESAARKRGFEMHRHSVEMVGLCPRCARAQARAEEATDERRLLLIGNPNVGKSVVFSLLTGVYVVVSNYPGTTVEVSRGKLRGLRREVEVVDTPGVNDLTPLSLDEMVTRDMLLEDQPARVVQVIDARNLERGLSITAELADMGVPVVVCLNMMDEARRAGIEIDVAALKERLGVEVIPTVAVERRGIAALFRSLRDARPARLDVAYRPEIEASAELLEALLPEAPISRRSLALMLLAEDASLRGWLVERVTPEQLEEIDRIVAEAQADFQRPLSHLIASTRREQVEHLTDQVVTRRTVSSSRVRETISAACMHPILGLIVLLGVLYLVYLAVGKFAAGTVVDYLEGTVFGNAGGALVAYPPDGAGGRWEFHVPATEEAHGVALTLRQGSPDQPAGLASLLPGKSAPHFLRTEERYRYYIRLDPADDTAGMVLACQLHYVESAESQLELARVGADGTAEAVFTPRARGAQYSLVLLGPGRTPRRTCPGALCTTC